MEATREKRPWLRKSILILACITGPILIVRIVGLFTGWLQFYTVPTPGHEPAVAQGAYLFASNLIEPKLLDHVCYDQRNPEFERSIWVKRICGVAGDTVLIKQGELFVNGRNIDRDLQLKHNYLFNRQLAYVLADQGFFRYEEARPNARVAAEEAPMEDARVMGDKRFTRAYFVGPDPYMPEWARSHGWTQDDFGPVVVPEGSFFLLGDNRNYSLDSRYTGFVAREDVLGVMIWTIDL